MQRIDLPQFEALMQEVAEVYDHRPYGEGALKHWVQSLSEFPFEKVRHRLLLWRDSKPKLPTISDIVTSLRTALSDDLERRAARDKQVLSVFPTPVTRIGTAAVGAIRQMLNNPRPPGAWWAYELRDRHRAGKPLYWLQMEMAKLACGHDWDTSKPYDGQGKADRVPGEDDE